MTDAIESSVDRALARLDARPAWRLTCWQCGHSDEVPSDPDRGEFRCDQCGASTAFGTPMPRITITPHADRRFLVTKFEQGVGDKQVAVDIVLARHYAAEYALEILSVTEPAAYRAMVAMMSRTRGAAAPEVERPGLVLDRPAGLPCP